MITFSAGGVGRGGGGHRERIPTLKARRSDKIGAQTHLISEEAQM